MMSHANFLVNFIIFLGFSLYGSWGLAENTQKKYTPYEFEPGFHSFVKSKIPTQLTQTHEDTVYNHLSKIIDPAESLESQVLDIDENEFDWTLKNILSSPKAKKIQITLSNWRAKHRLSLDLILAIYINSFFQALSLTKNLGPIRLFQPSQNTASQ